MNDSPILLLPEQLTEKCGFDSIRKVIDSHIRTPDGHRRIASLTPMSDPDRVKRLGGESREMLHLLHEGQSLSLPELEPIGSWLETSSIGGSLLPLEAFPEIAKHCRTARQVRSELAGFKEMTPILNEIAGDLIPLKPLEERIRSAISEQGEVLDSASPELNRIRKQIRSRRGQLRNTIEKIYRQTTKNGFASDEGPTLRSGRMVIPIKAEFKRKVDGFVHDLSGSGQTVYIEPVQVLDQNNEIRQLELSEKQEIEAILEALTREIGREREKLESNHRILGSIDLVHGRCLAARQWNGVIPALSDDRVWKLNQARNPNLLLRQSPRLRDNIESDTDGEAVVPLDLELSDSEQGILISGPNAGGKSVTLKTVALLVCMNQCGIPVPLRSDSRLPVLTALFLDLGDEQSIEQDLSTFSSRLHWMQRVLKQVSGQSLVLIDEAGTGTDPEEGSAIFRAFMEQVLEKGAQLIATTHHGALKLFADEHPGLVNAAMEFDQATLAPTYRFRKGLPGSSYAFEIAERLNLPADLLDRARTLLGGQRERMSQMLLNLEQELQQVKSERSRLDKSRKELEGEKTDYKSLRRELDEKRDELLRNAYREADRIMGEANRTIEQAVEQIRMSGPEQQERIRSARKEVKRKQTDIHKERNKRDADAERRSEETRQQPPAVGDRVKLRESDTVGELVELEDDRAIVLVNGLRIKTSSDQLQVTSKPSDGGNSGAEKVRAWKHTATSRDTQPLSPSIDLRGMRSREAIRELTLYLDKAFMRGLHQVDIIHGKGEGILRKWVHEHLESRKEVDRFHEAPIERGGGGCTMVYFETSDAD